jgi:hypothetical protein
MQYVVIPVEGRMAKAKKAYRTVKNTTDARAGVTGQNVRAVLVASVVGSILLIIVVAALTLH